MTYKPLSRKVLEKYLKFVGWSLQKGGFDWSVINSEGKFICSIIITHGNTKSEACAHSVKKIENKFKERGMTWPPKKKLKGN